MPRRPRTVRAHDVQVRVRNPLVAALLCLVTGGIWGVVHHYRTSRELSRFGRARGRMPFAFVSVNAGASTTGWIAGLLAWYLVVGILIAVGIDLASGGELAAEDITSFSSLVLLLAPLWLVLAATTRRIRTAQHLAGVPRAFPSPARVATMGALFPPLATWQVQQQLNRVWRQYP